MMTNELSANSRRIARSHSTSRRSAENNSQVNCELCHHAILDTVVPVVFLAILSIFPYLLLAGCKDQANPKSGLRPQIAAFELRGAEIKAGWGIERCHIGMSIDECIASLGDPDERKIDRDAFLDGTMSWYDLGLMVAFKDDAIVQVYFRYLEYEYSPFPGLLYADASATDAMSAVTAKYGKPESIDKGRISDWLPSDAPSDKKEFHARHFTGKMEAWYNYPTQGIDVYFVGGELSYVWVYVPQE